MKLLRAFGTKALRPALMIKMYYVSKMQDCYKAISLIAQ